MLAADPLDSPHTVPCIVGTKSIRPSVNDHKDRPQDFFMLSKLAALCVGQNFYSFLAESFIFDVQM